VVWWMIVVPFAIRERTKVHDIDKAHIVHTRLIKFSLRGSLAIW
jgi:hypothetical protein